MNFGSLTCAMQGKFVEIMATNMEFNDYHSIHFFVDISSLELQAYFQLHIYTVCLHLDNFKWKMMEDSPIHLDNPHVLVEVSLLSWNW